MSNPARMARRVIGLPLVASLLLLASGCAASLIGDCILDEGEGETIENVTSGECADGGGYFVPYQFESSIMGPV